MIVKIEKSNIKGNVFAPPSKSFTHRALICATFSDGVSHIKNIEYSNDVVATINCLRQFGVNLIEEKNEIIVYGIGNKLEEIKRENNLLFFDCNESASTYRFLIPISLVLSDNVVFAGTKKLLSRPITEYEKNFSNININIKKEDDKIRFTGKLVPYEYIISENISSQFVSGLLFALPLLNENSRIVILKNLESINYVDMTIYMLKKYGIYVNKIINKNNLIFEINGNQKYKKCDYSVECDYTNVAVFIALKKFYDVNVLGLDDNTIQSDKECNRFFKIIESGFNTINVGNNIDLVPLLMVYSVLFNGARFINTKRLRIKESDRINSMKEELKKCNIEMKVFDNEVIIENPKFIKPKEKINSHNDHRIVMAFTFLGLIYGLSIDGYECINKSFPSFFEKIKNIGGEYSIL